MSKNYKLDFDRLFKTLCDAEEKEAKYWRENDAKFRAVHQKVASYDEFREIVQASHLKPLDKKDRIDSKFYQPWNILASKHSQEIDGLSPSTSKNKCNQTDIKDFKKFWNSSKGTRERFNFLVNSDDNHLKKIFAFDNNCELLGDVIVELNNNYTREEASKIINMLSMLANVNRFKLLMEFLTKQEKNSVEVLFKKLELDFEDKNSVLNMKNIYMS